MKAFAVLFSLLAAWSAQAVSMNGWERPVFRSQMDVVEARSGMSNVGHVDLVMTQQNGSPVATGFVLLIDDQPMDFAVRKVKSDGCGGYDYLAMPIQSGSRVSIHSYQLVVVDHSEDRCSERPAGEFHALPLDHAWEAALMDQGQPLLRLAGDPEVVRASQ